MASSLSRKQIDKLGVRLADQTATADDQLAFAEFVFRHARALDVAVERITEASGLAPSARVKTRDTMLDKVRRGTRLSTIQDIAGARVVRPMTWAEQDRVSDAIAQRFPGAKIKDRRREPSHGYRAVHIIATVEDCSVEIQVRTPLQDLWAELSERLARRVGRGIRYGEAADRADLVIGGVVASDIISELQRFSELIAAAEIVRTDSSDGVGQLEATILAAREGKQPSARIAASEFIDASSEATAAIGEVNAWLLKMRAVLAELMS